MFHGASYDILTTENNYHSSQQPALQALVEVNVNLTSAMSSCVIGPLVPLTLTRQQGGAVILGKEAICHCVTPLLGPIAGPLIHALSGAIDSVQTSTGGRQCRGRGTVRKQKHNTRRKEDIMIPPPLTIGLFDGRTETILIFNYFLAFLLNPSEFRYSPITVGHHINSNITSPCKDSPESVMRRRALMELLEPGDDGYTQLATYPFLANPPLTADHNQMPSISSTVIYPSVSAFPTQYHKVYKLTDLVMMANEVALNKGGVLFPIAHTQATQASVTLHKLLYSCIFTFLRPRFSASVTKLFASIISELLEVLVILPPTLYQTDLCQSTASGTISVPAVKYLAGNPYDFITFSEEITNTGVTRSCIKDDIPFPCEELEDEYSYRRGTVSNTVGIMYDVCKYATIIQSVPIGRESDASPYLFVVLDITDGWCGVASESRNDTGYSSSDSSGSLSSSDEDVPFKCHSPHSTVHTKDNGKMGDTEKIRELNDVLEKKLKKKEGRNIQMIHGDIPIGSKGDINGYRRFIHTLTLLAQCGIRAVLTSSVLPNWWKGTSPVTSSTHQNETAQSYYYYYYSSTVTLQVPSDKEHSNAIYKMDVIHGLDKVSLSVLLRRYNCDPSHIPASNSTTSPSADICYNSVVHNSDAPECHHSRYCFLDIGSTTTLQEIKEKVMRRGGSSCLYTFPFCSMISVGHRHASDKQYLVIDGLKRHQYDGCFPHNNTSHRSVTNSELLFAHVAVPSVVMVPVWRKALSEAIVKGCQGLLEGFVPGGGMHHAALAQCIYMEAVAVTAQSHCNSSNDSEPKRVCCASVTSLPLLQSVAKGLADSLLSVPIKLCQTAHMRRNVMLRALEGRANGVMTNLGVSIPMEATPFSALTPNSSTPVIISSKEEALEYYLVQPAGDVLREVLAVLRAMYAMLGVDTVLHTG